MKDSSLYWKERCVVRLGDHRWAFRARCNHTRYAVCQVRSAAKLSIYQHVMLCKFTIVLIVIDNCKFAKHDLLLCSLLGEIYRDISAWHTEEEIQWKLITSIPIHYFVDTKHIRHLQIFEYHALSFESDRLLLNYALCLATPSGKLGNGQAKFAYNFQNGHHRSYIMENYLIFSRSWKYFVGKLL